MHQARSGTRYPRPPRAPCYNQASTASPHERRFSTVLKRFFGLDRGTERTRETFFGRLRGLFRRASIDEALWEGLEALLLQADVGVATTTELLDRLRDRVAQGNVHDGDELYQALREELELLLVEAAPEQHPLLRSDTLNVVLVVGVN